MPDYLNFYSVKSLSLSATQGLEGVEKECRQMSFTEKRQSGIIAVTHHVRTSYNSPFVTKQIPG